MIICAFDLETTGLSPETDTITEVGAILYDTETNSPVKFFSKLIAIDRPIPEVIVELTGITDVLLAKYGEAPSKVWREFEEFIEPAELFLAHNAPFDRGFVEKIIPDMADPKLWIDSCVDVEYPDHIKTRQLTYLAADHGIVNPFSHRAVTDVLTMLRVVSNYNWEEIISNAKTPNVTMRAMVTFNDNQKAKTAGYRWDSERKFWIKSIKETRTNQETLKCRDLGFLSKRI